MRDAITIDRGTEASISARIGSGLGNAFPAQLLPTPVIPVIPLGPLGAAVSMIITSGLYMHNRLVCTFWIADKLMILFAFSQTMEPVFQRQRDSCACVYVGRVCGG